MVHSARKHIRRQRDMDESPLNAGILNTILLVRMFCSDYIRLISWALKPLNVFVVFSSKVNFWAFRWQSQVWYFAWTDVTCTHFCLETLETIIIHKKTVIFLKRDHPRFQVLVDQNIKMVSHMYMRTWTFLVHIHMYLFFPLSVPFSRCGGGETIRVHQN